MIVLISKYLVLLVGVLIAVLCLWGFVMPQRLITLVRSVVDQNWGFPFAIIVRVLLGMALIIVAPESLFPNIIELLGWISLLAAIALVFLGRQRMSAIMAWFAGMPVVAVRIWLIFGAAFGVFLVYVLV